MRYARIPLILVDTVTIDKAIKFARDKFPDALGMGLRIKYSETIEHVTPDYIIVHCNKDGAYVRIYPDDTGETILKALELKRKRWV